MAIIPIPDLWYEVDQGSVEFTSRIQELEAGAEVEVSNIVRYIRSIPAADDRKKAELAAFFQSEAGSKYTRAERKAAYDELLGEGRNRELRG